MRRSACRAEVLRDACSGTARPPATGEDAPLAPEEITQLAHEIIRCDARWIALGPVRSSAQLLRVFLQTKSPFVGIWQH